jgi:hypothetical protein
MGSASRVRSPRWVSEWYLRTLSLLLPFGHPRGVSLLDIQVERAPSAEDRKALLPPHQRYSKPESTRGYKLPTTPLWLKEGCARNKNQASRRSRKGERWAGGIKG